MVLLVDLVENREERSTKKNRPKVCNPWLFVRGTFTAIHVVYHFHYTHCCCCCCVCLRQMFAANMFSISAHGSSTVKIHTQFEYFSTIIIVCEDRAVQRKLHTHILYNAYSMLISHSWIWSCIVGCTVCCVKRTSMFRVQCIHRVTIDVTSARANKWACRVHCIPSEANEWSGAVAATASEAEMGARKIC